MKKIFIYFSVLFLCISQSRNPSIIHENDYSRQLAINFLLSKQNPNGSWGEYGGNPAYTSLVIRSLCQEKQGTVIFKKQLEPAISYLLKNIAPDFSVVNPGPRSYKNYTSSVALIAFYLYDKQKFRDLIIKIRNSIKKNQFDESYGIEAGGIGYGSNSKKSDLSNTQYALEALFISNNLEESNKNEQVIWDRAVEFIKRCQVSKKNPLPWIKVTEEDLGGFLYSPDRSMVEDTQLRSYGSMTYAAVKSMLYAKLTPKDERIKLALQWIKNHYTTKENPKLGQMGYYYYINTFAKTLRILGMEKIVNKQNQIRLWKDDLTKTLVSKQNPNGSWQNKVGRWQENNPILSTCYALMALQYASKLKSFYETL